MICKVCGKELNRITNTHLKLHDMTQQEYKDEFNVKLYYHTEETKQKMSDNNWMKTNDGKEWASKRAYYNGFNKARTGISVPHTNESKKKLSEARRCYYKEHPEAIINMTGENHYNWKGGKSYEEYPVIFNNQYKECIRKYYNRVCQLCGDKDSTNRRLSIHHIDYNKDNCDANNLIPLCVACHQKTNYNEDKWEIFFKIRKAQEVCNTFFESLKELRNTND